jgi:hypothetical protein
MMGRNDIKKNIGWLDNMTDLVDRAQFMLDLNN